MKKQPQSFINMVAAVTDQKDKKHGFKNTDEVGKVPHAIKECAEMVVTLLTEAEEVEDVQEFKVYPSGPEDTEFERKFVGTRPGEICFNIQLPETPVGRYVNKIWVPAPLDDSGISRVEKRMVLMAKHRDYPAGSFFVAPWGTYLIHGGTIGRI